MNESHQEIARETWDKIRDLTSVGNGKTDDFVAIILAAIEKALAPERELKDHCERRYAKLCDEYRTLHEQLAAERDYHPHGLPKKP